MTEPNGGASSMLAVMEEKLQTSPRAAHIGRLLLVEADAFKRGKKEVVTR